MKHEQDIFDRFGEIGLMFVTVYDSYLAYLQSPAVHPHIPVGEHIHELDKLGNHRIVCRLKTDLFQTGLVLKALKV